MTAVGPGTDAALIGRVHEREELAAALVSLRSGSGRVLVIEGEPGIGKTRLLLELAALADGQGCAVLSARASEFERDLPYALWSEAVDPHLTGLGERRVRLLGLLDPDPLAGLAPGMPVDLSPASDLAGSSVVDRHRVHRALRDLLGRLAATRALVVCLDDVHWADPASLDALAALVRRPPAAALVLALAAREGQLPVALSRALAAAMSGDRAARIELSPLSSAEADELLGESPGAIFSLSGGNPFTCSSSRAHMSGTLMVACPVRGSCRRQLRHHWRASSGSSHRRRGCCLRRRLWSAIRSSPTSLRRLPS